jgi:hypothetical protein
LSFFEKDCVCTVKTTFDWHFKVTPSPRAPRLAGAAGGGGGGGKKKKTEKYRD